MYNSKQLKQMTSLHLIVVFNCLSLYWLDVNLLHIHLSMVLLQIHFASESGNCLSTDFRYCSLLAVNHFF